MYIHYFFRLSASFFSKLIFDWETPLIWKGYRRPLVHSDLWSCDPLTSSSGVVPTFDAHYQKSAKKVGAASQSLLFILEEHSNNTFVGEDQCQKE